MIYFSSFVYLNNQILLKLFLNYYYSYRLCENISCLRYLNHTDEPKVSHKYFDFIIKQRHNFWTKYHITKFLGNLKMILSIKYILKCKKLKILIYFVRETNTSNNSYNTMLRNKLLELFLTVKLQHNWFCFVYLRRSRCFYIYIIQFQCLH